MWFRAGAVLNQEGADKGSLCRHFAIEGESDSESEGSEDGCSLPVAAEALAGDLMAQLPTHTGHEPPVLGEALGAPGQAFEAEVAEMSEADQERVRGSSQVTGPNQFLRVASTVSGSRSRSLPAHLSRQLLTPMTSLVSARSSRAERCAWKLTVKRLAELRPTHVQLQRCCMQASSSSGDENRPPVSANNAGRKGEAPPLLKQSANSMDLGGPLVRSSFASAAVNGHREEGTMGTDPQCRGTAQVQPLRL